MTELLPPDSAGIARAVALLLEGELVALPTETVYGLGADATNAEAVARIYAVKERPRFNPLICHYPDAEAAFAHVEASALALQLAKAFWPGPLTLVLPRKPDCPLPLLVSAGLETLAVRVPQTALTLALLRALSRPLAAPSANRSGAVSPTEPAHVLAELGGRIAAVLNGPACPIGVESTVIDLTEMPPRLLRPGGLPRKAIEAFTGPLAGPLPHEARAPQALRSPGQLASHYAPRAKLRLEAREVAANEALLAFGPPLAGAAVTFSLSSRGDLVEAAARLFSGLRWLDQEVARLDLAGIAAMPIPEEGLGEAINDRLRRAAAPRPLGRRMEVALHA
ncbi:MAG: threonylcarbamoyl-AMP synthase [Acidobacteriia bacterium]|nr:threonylcarbamoyl-AMP synthase [Methyloceanibacter sp.]MCL6490972.1 threonylcarbamoyl-AMP synthase [Terriglobia bacterium]